MEGLHLQRSRPRGVGTLGHLKSQMQVTHTWEGVTEVHRGQCLSGRQGFMPVGSTPWQMSASPLDSRGQKAPKAASRPWEARTAC